MRSRRAAPISQRSDRVAFAVFPRRSGRTRGGLMLASWSVLLVRALAERAMPVLVVSCLQRLTHRVQGLRDPRGRSCAGWPVRRCHSAYSAVAGESIAWTVPCVKRSGPSDGCARPNRPIPAHVVRSRPLIVPAGNVASSAWRARPSPRGRRDPTIRVRPRPSPDNCRNSWPPG